MSTHSLTCAYRAISWTGLGAPARYGSPLVDTVTGLTSGAHAPTGAFGVAMTSTVTLSSTAARAYAAGGAISDTLTMADAQALAAKFEGYATVSATFSSALALALTAGWSDTATFSSALAAIYGLAIVESLKAGGAAAGAAKYAQALADTMTLTSIVGKFTSLAFLDTLTLSGAPFPLWRFNSVVADTAQLSEALGPQMLFSVVAHDDVTFGDAEALRMIFTGAIRDVLRASVSYVEPNNAITTWAINTRTSAITEYSNFAYVSFAQVGDTCLAASSEGLYELTGPDDAGQNVVGRIAGGWMQPGGSRFTSFKAAYIGTTQTGDFLLKLTTGTGETYVYAARSRPMQTTRINLGKGLRARYFKYELEAVDGHDFDLDSIEFLPLVAQRRVN